MSYLLERFNNARLTTCFSAFSNIKNTIILRNSKTRHIPVNKHNKTLQSYNTHIDTTS